MTTPAPASAGELDLLLNWREQAQHEIDRQFVVFGGKEDWPQQERAIWDKCRNEAKAAILALIARADREGRLDELLVLKNSRDVDTEAMFCQYCHMLLEDSEQECACLIIYEKRIAALTAGQEGE